MDPHEATQLCATQISIEFFKRDSFDLGYFNGAPQRKPQPPTSHPAVVPPNHWNIDGLGSASQLGTRRFDLPSAMDESNNGLSPVPPRVWT